MSDYIEEMWRLALQGDAQGVWFWVAFYTFLVCAYSVVFQVRTRGWPRTEGKLVRASVEPFGAREMDPSARDYRATALYGYEVSGVAFDGTRISPWVFVVSHNLTFLLEKHLSVIERLPDGGVRVYYNPRNPRKSYLAVAGWVGICITLLLAALPGLLYLSRYHTP